MCNHFETNLFRKRCTKFHKNRPNFIEDVTKNVLVSFFLDTVYNICCCSHDSCRYFYALLIFGIVYNMKLSLLGQYRH